MKITIEISAENMKDFEAHLMKFLQPELPLVVAKKPEEATLALSDTPPVAPARAESAGKKGRKPKEKPESPFAPVEPNLPEDNGMLMGSEPEETSVIDMGQLRQESIAPTPAPTQPAGQMAVNPLDLVTERKQAAAKLTGAIPGTRGLQLIQKILKTLGAENLSSVKAEHHQFFMNGIQSAMAGESTPPELQ